ncbi:SDR family oxidoreductase [Mitsuaria sp. 7]|uniref:SDR family oxidoreductase n=1 Tax=Mitsuaria sp. 7 TaxID=1658665 RepID=UPI0007DD7278|nr:SDR family oxidoreductase [Mitsuaria sp. 7]ANH67434.1 quinone oxidoreductase [Mitsuaria sp. 7]
MIAITGAAGHLGGLAVRQLLKKLPANEIVAVVRDLEKADELRELGVQLRVGDYDRPDTLRAAFEGVEKLLLVSAVVPGQRLRQHQAVIDAAKDTGVQLVAYTSMLRADSSTLSLAREHHQTEEYLKRSGLAHVLLRNGWYFENTTAGLADAVTHGAIIGSSGQGRLASASREDYAGAAVEVLTQPGHAGKTYELVGDQSFSMTGFAEEVSRQAGRPVVYRDLAPTDFAAALLSWGLPQMIVDVVVDASVKSGHGELDDASRDLSRLLGRPTTSLADAVATALRG